MDKKLCPALSKVVVCNRRGMGTTSSFLEAEFFEVWCRGKDCMSWDEEKQKCDVC